MNDTKPVLSPYVQEVQRGDKYIFINPNIPRWIVTNELGKLILSLFNGENSYDEIISEIERLHLREDTFAILLDYCLIVPMDKQEYFYYSYREKVRLEHEQDYRYKLSKALYIHFKPQSL